MFFDTYGPALSEPPVPYVPPLSGAPSPPVYEPPVPNLNAAATEEAAALYAELQPFAEITEGATVYTSSFDLARIDMEMAGQVGRLAGDTLVITTDSLRSPLF